MLSLLDFSLSPKRLESVRYDVLDDDLNKVGQVYTVGQPTLTIDRYKQVKRTLTGVSLLPPDAQRLTFRTRLAPVWVFDDGSTYDLGVFVLNDETVGPQADGRLDAVTMGDQMVLYREPLEQSFVVRPGDSILDKLVELHGLATTPAPYVAYSHLTVLARNGLVWEAGTPISDVMEELAASAAIRAWFTRTGTLRFDPLIVEDEIVDVSHEMEGTLKFNYSNDDTPNRWEARDNSTDFSVEGVYDLPDSAPHSFAKRGRRVTHSVEVPGLIGQDADDAAFAAALDEEFPYKEASLDLPGRPDLDVFDSLLLSNGQVFRLDGATTELGPSGKTSIRCQAYWENPDTVNAEVKTSFEGSEPVGGDAPPLRAQMMWSPAFLKYWRSLTPRERNRLRAYLDALERQKLERQEQRARDQARLARIRQRRQRRRRPRRAGRVQSYDPHLHVATVLLDGDPQGTEVPVRMESDVPGPDQRVMVQFNSPSPSVVGVEGGIQRLLGYAEVTSNQDIASTAPTAITDAEVEVSITQPGRLISVTAQAIFSIAGGSALMFVQGHIQRDDGAGTYADIGRFAQTLGLGGHGTGELLSGFTFDPSPDPGVYSYRLRAEGSAQPYRVASAASATRIMVWDVGADPLATFS